MRTAQPSRLTASSVVNQVVGTPTCSDIKADRATTGGGLRWARLRTTCRRRTSRVGPSRRTFPSAITTTLRAYFATMSMSCVTRMTVFPVPLSVCRRSMISIFIVRSCPVVGSSTRMILGSAERAAARASRLRSPRLILVDEPDRKSTRLNSSHMSISYAVFCLKKKKKKKKIIIQIKKKKKKKKKNNKYTNEKKHKYDDQNL